MAFNKLVVTIYNELNSTRKTFWATVTAIGSLLVAVATSVIAIGQVGLHNVLYGKDYTPRIWLLALITINIASTLRAGAGKGFMLPKIEPVAEQDATKLKGE